MRHTKTNALLLAVFISHGCDDSQEKNTSPVVPSQTSQKETSSGDANPLTAGAMTGPPVNPGKTPESTLYAYYYYGDHGEGSKLNDLITNSITDEPLQDGPGRGEATRKARGVVVEHKEINGTEAVLYYRTWFSATAARRGGRPAVARLVKEDGTWKFDVKETLKRILQNTKGKTRFGFYDGSKEWWK